MEKRRDLLLKFHSEREEEEKAGAKESQLLDTILKRLQNSAQLLVISQ